MNAETVGDKYRAIAEIYSPEASRFAKKLLGIFAQARGEDSVLWSNIHELYQTGEIVVYEEDMDLNDVQDKMLLRHAIPGQEFETYEVNAAFGFVDAAMKPVFAELPHDLWYAWDRENLTTLTTAILNIGRTFHHQLAEDPGQANNASLMVNAMLIVNRLSDRIREQKINTSKGR